MSFWPLLMTLVGVVSGSAPTLTSVLSAVGSWAVGDIDGGYSVTLTGTNFTGATGVTFGGTAATSVVVVNPTTITCIVPAHASGAVSVVVTTPSGSNGANSLWTYYSPAQEAETGWWRSFANPTTATASAGTSGSNGNLAPGVAPTFGTLNAHADAIFNGSTQYFQTAAATSSLLGLANGFIEAMVFITSAPATSGVPYTDAQILSDNGPNAGTCFSSAGGGNANVQGYIYDGAYKTTPAATASIGAWHYIQMWWDSTNVNIRVDGGATQSTPAGAVSAFGSAMTLATNFLASVFSNVTVAEVLTGNVAPTATQRNNRRAYNATRYGQNV